MDIGKNESITPVDNQTLLEILDEEDFSDVLLLEKIARQIVISQDNEEIRTMLKKMHFSFLANNESYRMQALEKLEKIFSQFSLEKLSSLCCDSLVGNYLTLLVILRRIPIINANSVAKIVSIIPSLEYKDDLLSFGFLYPEQVFLEVDERVSNLSKEEIEKLAVACIFLFQLGYLKKNRATVDSFKQIFDAVGKIEYSLRANMIKSLIDEDAGTFFALLQRFGLNFKNNQEIIANYCDVVDALQKLLLPIYFSAENIRFNGSLFNNNFSILLYKNISGIDDIVFPFKQVKISEVSKVFDLQTKVFYTPRERYGRLLLRDIYSFKDIQTIESSTPEAVSTVTSLDEDKIAEKIRLVLKDANLTHHGPVEITDILTQNVFVNNPDDLRTAGFILKGKSFEAVHLNTIAGQLLKASHSIAKVIFLVFTSRLDDQAQTYFVNECESKQKNYCIVDRNELARLFTSYNVL
jgi:hypothetical protein